MENMENRIKAHNDNISNKQQHQETNTCNCRKKEECPLPGRCTTKNIVYKAIVSTPQDSKQYIGLTATSFKTRYAAHKTSFTDNRKRNTTELSKYIWNLKDKNITYNIKWTIVQHARPYSPRTKRCNLCLSEKYHIITSPKDSLLNSRSELISTCRHRKKFLLSEHG